MLGALRLLLRSRRPSPMAPVQGVKDCCKLSDNLLLIEAREQLQANGQRVPIEVRRCKVCSCKHHRMIVGQRLQPGKVTLG